MLALYERMRMPRARNVKRRSKYMHDICQLTDGPTQRERDRVLLEEEPGDGFPNPWADPGYQTWMWGFNARDEAECEWKKYSHENNYANKATGKKLSKL